MERRMILVGVDGTAPSRTALEWSVKRATATGEGVLLAHVLDDEWGMMGSHLMDEMRRDAEAMLAGEAMRARAQGPRVPLDTLLLSGNPMWELASAAARATLVAVGTHKTGFVRGRVFGSRSLQLAASAAVPVAIVPVSPTVSRHGVVVGVNASPAAEAAVRFAADEAHRSDQELVILGSVSAAAGEGASEQEGTRAAFVASQMEAVLGRARDQVRALHPELTVRVRQMSKLPADALVEASGTAVMLVVGRSRHPGEPTALGTVAHDVLLNLSAPTVVVHARRQQ